MPSGPERGRDPLYNSIHSRIPARALHSGLVGFTADLARQTVAHNVTINNLLPGVFDSDAQREHIRGMLADTGKTFDKLWEERVRSNPADRYGRTEETGAYFAFLCGAHAGYITGQNLLIDGGGRPGTI
ncbi:SDR family oxidoreductase [Nitratireductor sp. GISD-1A_MAKvit]|uniref:SDR family oxidoreductase n=1 Tax=Nitratireductor sp. GISD-1A_MAKvit TaxID=3234198 RepID=UPI003467AE60